MGVRVQKHRSSTKYHDFRRVQYPRMQTREKRNHSRAQDEARMSWKTDRDLGQPCPPTRCFDQLRDVRWHIVRRTFGQVIHPAKAQDGIAR